MGIEDRRKDKKSDITKKNFTGLIKSCFSHSDQSLCNLKIHETNKETIKGKRISVSSYKLFPNDYSNKTTWAINNNVEIENEKRKTSSSFTKIDNNRTPELIYENMVVIGQGDDDKINTRKILKKNQDSK